MEYAGGNRVTPAAVALGYLLCNRVKALAVVGCKNGEQLRDTLTAADIELSEATVDWLLNGTLSGKPDKQVIR